MSESLLVYSGRPKDKFIQFALDLKDIPESTKAKLKFPMLISEKKDGVFCIAEKLSDGSVRILSRTGKQYTSMKHIENALAPLLDHGILMIFEAYMFNSDLGVISGKARDTKRQHPELIAYCHDLLTEEEFRGIYPYGRPFKERNRYLKNILHLISPPLFRIVQIPCESLEQALEIAKSVWANGGEGVILRDPLALYEGGKRIPTIIKIKEEVFYDLEVVAINEGREGKFKGMCGSIVCKFKHGELVTMDGMKLKERKAWWADPSLIIGKIVLVRAMKDSSKGKLRELKYKGIREDKVKGDY